jgi:heme-binding NEAT domain protein
MTSEGVKKMRKWMLTLLIAIFALPFFSGAVLAEETSEFEDGEYEIGYEVKKEKEDVTSAADGFMTKPATLTVENGNQYIELELTSSDMIKSLAVPSGEVDIVNEDEEEKTRMVGFEVEGNLSEAVLMEMHVAVPGVYEETHKARAFFDVSEVPEKAEEETNKDEPAEDTNEEESIEPEEEPTEPKLSDLTDGYYTVDASYLKSDSEETSTMGRYLDSSLFLSVADGKAKVIVTVNENDTVTLLQLNDKNAVETIVDGDKRYETYEFDSLTSLFDAYVEYQAPYEGGVYEGEAEFRVSLNEESITVVDASEKPGADVEDPGDNDKPGDIEEPKDNEGPGDSKDPGNNQKPKDNEDSVDRMDDTQEPGENPKPKDQLKPDKAFEIDFIIKHETENKPSAGDSFFKKPGVLLYKDGEKYLQLTVTGSQFIDSLKTTHGDMVIVKENGDGSIVVQLKVDGKISEMIELDMVITVPGVYENQNHKARLFLDEISMKELDASDYYLIASDNGNGPTVEGATVGKLLSTDDNNEVKPTNETKTPEKPELGPGEGNDGSVEQTTASGQETNPKTGDTNSILLYVLLMIGSAIPLAIKLKNRFV